MGSGIVGVRITTGATDRIVTAHATGIRFRRVAGGGPADAQVTILLPRSAFPDLSAADKVRLYDTRTGRTIWEGFTQNPGSQANDDGESFELNAHGVMTVTRQQAQRLIYRTTSYESWGTDDTGNTPSASASVGTFPEGSGARAGQAAVFTQLTPGTPVGTGTGKAMMLTKLFADSTQGVGGLAGYRDGGVDSADFKTRLGFWPFTAWEVNVDLATPGVTVTLTAGTDFDYGKSGILFGLAHTGAATNITTDDRWAALGVDAILGDRVDEHGNRYPLPTLDYVLAHEVVADMVGRLGSFDPERVSIETTTSQLDELAYVEPARMQQVLEDLLIYEPDFTYEVQPAGADGRYGFVWRQWPTKARYEVGEDDAYSEQGSDDELANRIAVAWTDATGAAQTTIVVSDVPALGGKIVDADPVTLPGTGTVTKALALGQQLLGALAAPSRAGQAVLSGRIKDLRSGGWVLPHEVVPGELVRVRHLGIDLRLTETNYDDDEGTVTLTLGDPVYTTEQRVAALADGRVLRRAANGYQAPTARYDSASYSTLYVYA